MANDLREIPLKDIRENPNALRRVNRQTAEYQEIVDSIKKRGVYNPILVRECLDPVSKEPYFSLIDGAHRFNGSKDAGKETVPAHVVSMADADVIEAQIIANVQKVNTSPTQYAKALVGMLSLNPLLTLTELAGRLSKSRKWVEDRLSLNDLDEGFKPLIDEGKIPLSNAYALAKLPPDEQPNFLDRAMTMQPTEFLPTVNDRVKELREAQRQGRQPSTEFKPIEVLKKSGEFKEELQSFRAGNELLAKLEITSPIEAWKMAIRWGLNVDPDSVQRQIAADKARKEKLAAEKEQRKRERIQREADEAAKTASEFGSQGVLAKYLGIEPMKPVDPTGHSLDQGQNGEPQGEPQGEQAAAPEVPQLTKV